MTKSTTTISVFSLAGFGLMAQAATSVHLAPRVHTGGVGLVLVGAQRRTLSSVTAAQADGAITRGLVSADRKTLTFHQPNIYVVARSGPASDMLSYRIDGLRNPTLVVPRGAIFKVLYINTDDDMTHNLRFGRGHAASTPSVGTPNLAHKSNTAFHAADMTLRMPTRPGNYYYFCTVPGHAQGGMWGSLRIH